MITVIIVNDGNHNKLKLTLDSLKDQHYRDFKVVIMDPHGEITNGISCPPEINNQINTAVYRNTSNYYFVTCSGCIVLPDVLENIKQEFDCVVGPVRLASKNVQPDDMIKPNSYVYGEVDNFDNANYNNLAFSHSYYTRIGGFNAELDTQFFFIQSTHKRHYQDKYVLKVLDFATKEMDDIYIIHTGRKPEYVKWTPIYDSVTPQKPNLLITIGTGAYNREILTYTEGNMYEYAATINADYIQLINTTQEWWGLEKFRLYDIAKHYERILFVDADVWINPGSPNIFDVVPPGSVGMVSDEKFNCEFLDKKYHPVFNGLKEMCWHQGLPYTDCKLYNSGVIVFDKEQRDIIKPPPKPFIPKHCFEQHWIESQLHRLQYDIYELEEIWNNEYWKRNHEELKNKSYFLHGVGHDYKMSWVYELYVKDRKTKDNDLITVEYKDIKYKKTKDICIVTVCDDNNELIKLTGASHKKYAEKVGADYHVINEPDVNKDWGIANKYLITNFTKRYDKTLYVDSDVFIREGSPDIFNITPDDRIGIHNETYELEFTTYKDWVQIMYDMVCQHFHIQSSDVVPLNCGVMVIPKDVAYLYEKPEGEFPATWCFDQHWLDIMLKKYQQPYYEIGAIFNWEYPRPDWFSGINNAHFIHMSSIKCQQKRIDIIRKYLC